MSTYNIDVSKFRQTIQYSYLTPVAKNSHLLIPMSNSSSEYSGGGYSDLVREAKQAVRPGLVRARIAAAQRRLLERDCSWNSSSESSSDPVLERLSSLLLNTRPSSRCRQELSPAL